MCKKLVLRSKSMHIYEGRDATLSALPMPLHLWRLYQKYADFCHFVHIFCHQNEQEKVSDSKVNLDESFFCVFFCDMQSSFDLDIKV